MLEDREVMIRLAPDLFAEHRVAPIERYPDALLAALSSVAPSAAAAEPTIAVLTPGQFNSAYYEHCSWPINSASSSSRAAICSSRMVSSICAPRKARKESMSSTGGSTTVFLISARSSESRSSASPA